MAALSVQRKNGGIDAGTGSRSATACRSALLAATPPQTQTRATPVGSCGVCRLCHQYIHHRGLEAGRQVGDRDGRRIGAQLAHLA